MAKKYLIVKEDNLIGLQNRVNELMDDSYEPFGSLVAVEQNTYGTTIKPLYCQPMLLKEKETYGKC